MLICLICEHSFPSIEKYCLHVNGHKAIEDRLKSQQFNCPICLRTSSYQKISRLRVHMKYCYNQEQLQKKTVLNDEEIEEIEEVTNGKELFYEINCEDSMEIDNENTNIDVLRSTTSKNLA